MGDPVAKPGLLELTRKGPLILYINKILGRPGQINAQPAHSIQQAVQKYMFQNYRNPNATLK